MTLTPRTGLAVGFLINPPNGNIVVVPARTGMGEAVAAIVTFGVEGTSVTSR